MAVRPLVEHDRTSRPALPICLESGAAKQSKKLWLRWFDHGCVASESLIHDGALFRTGKMSEIKAKLSCLMPVMSPVCKWPSNPENMAAEVPTVLTVWQQKTGWILLVPLAARTSQAGSRPINHVDKFSCHQDSWFWLCRHYGAGMPMVPHSFSDLQCASAIPSSSCWLELSKKTNISTLIW